MASLHRRQFAAISAAVVIVLAWFGYRYMVNDVLPYSPIRPHRLTLDEIRLTVHGSIEPSQLGMRCDTLTVVTRDHLRLKGWFIHASSLPARGTIVLLHGIGSSRYMWLDRAHRLTHAGFNCLLYDSRANGESGGANCTFGYYERHDVQSAIDGVMQRYPSVAPFGVYGHSLGAAVALQAMAIDGRIECGIVESPFAVSASRRSAWIV